MMRQEIIELLDEFLASCGDKSPHEVWKAFQFVSGLHKPARLATQLATILNEDEKADVRRYLSGSNGRAAGFRLDKAECNFGGH